MAVASVIVGAAGVIFCFVPILGFTLAIAGLVLAILAITSRKLRGQQDGLKVAGLVVSIAGIIITLIVTLITMSGLFAAMDVAGNMTGIMNEMASDPKTQSLAAALFEEYTAIKAEQKFYRGNTADLKKTVESRYMNILQLRFRSLYNEGYRVEVEEDLMYKIVNINNK